MNIKPLVPDSDNLAILMEESASSGFMSVHRLVNEYESGMNRFNRPGGCILGVMGYNHVVGVGGLTIEPYESESTAGRLRRFYVLEKWRRSGVGSTLLKAIESRASDRFSVIQLYTPTMEAAAFYEANGYERCDRIKVSHVKTLGD